MKRRFFRKPIIPDIKESWYKEMVEGCRKYQKTNNCEKYDGVNRCSSCPFCIGSYCLLNILKTEFGDSKKL